MCYLKFYTFNKYLQKKYMYNIENLFSYSKKKEFTFYIHVFIPYSKETQN